MKNIYLMKYLQHILLHIGLCLLLASANLAFAQSTVMVSLENPQTNGLTIQFTISLGTTLTETQQLGVIIRIAGVSGSEIRSFNVITNNNDCPDGNFTPFLTFTPPPIPNLHEWRRTKRESTIKSE